LIAIAGRSYRMKDRAVPELPVTGAETRQALARKEWVGHFSTGDTAPRPNADEN
jgi:hypothetical protein